MKEKKYIGADEVAKALECSKSHAYKVISKLNDELAEKGCIVVHGKVDAKYFYSKIYGGASS